MPIHRGHVVLLPPNRVWRSYQGGALLDRLEGAAEPRDSHFPEDWIASTTLARTPGREQLREGISPVVVGAVRCDLKELLESDPDYFLGASHVAKYGPHPMVLVKFLDPAIRLHFQAHPTREFAQQRLGSPSGKTEAYYVLNTRDGPTGPYVYLGFQHPPTRAELRRMIAEQDVAGIERCFEKIRVTPGDTIVVPGGWPHAVGEGVMMLEIQEPTDLVVRFEFARGGAALPETARFMGRDVEFGLDVIDPTRHPLAEIDARQRCRPRFIRDLGPGSWQEELIGPEQTPCFRLRRTTIAGPIEKGEEEFHIAVVAEGSCNVSTPAGIHVLKQFDKILIPAGLGSVSIVPHAPTRIVECYPPR